MLSNRVMEKHHRMHQLRGPLGHSALASGASLTLDLAAESLRPSSKARSPGRSGITGREKPGREGSLSRWEGGEEHKPEASHPPQGEETSSFRDPKPHPTVKGPQSLRAPQLAQRISCSHPLSRGEEALMLDLITG